MRWYGQRKWAYRVGSYLSRGIAFVGLGVGIVLPLIPDSMSTVWFGINAGNQAEVAYIFLVIAGLVLATDAAFLYSQTWIRLRGAEAAIEKLSSEFQYDWLKIKANIPNDETAQEKSTEVLELLKSLVLSVNEVVNHETETWVTQLGEARSYLENRLKSAQTEIATVKKEQETQQEALKQAGKLPKTGALKVTIENPEQLEGKIDVMVAGKEETRPQPTRSIVFEDINPGLQKVKLLGKRSADQNVVNLEEIVSIKAGEAADVRFQVFEVVKN